MIRTVAIAGYRSLRDVVVELGQLTLITGANGAGKSSMYRALRLLADCGTGTMIASLAQEGGLPSVLWAGPEAGSGAGSSGWAAGSADAVQGTRRKGPVALKLGFASDSMSFATELGLPVDGSSPFKLDPEIKAETVWAGAILRRGNLLAKRRGPAVFQYHPGAEPARIGGTLAAYESMLTEVVDVNQAPELYEVRRMLSSWRFYDQLRTDAYAPARYSQIGTRSPVLNGDGSNVAAVLATIQHHGMAQELNAAIADAFPGSRLAITSDAGRFSMLLSQPGLLRPMAAAELSDGTLRYLQLLAALYTVNPPELMVLNEPETSLHPQLLPSLARLLVSAAQRTQLVVVTHSAQLKELILQTEQTAPTHPESVAVQHIELLKPAGETMVAGREGPLDTPAWNWPARHS